MKKQLQTPKFESLEGRLCFSVMNPSDAYAADGLAKYVSEVHAPLNQSSTESLPQSFGLRSSADILAQTNPVNSNSIIRDNIEYYMQTDKAVYSLGENVQMLYRVKNLGVEEWSIKSFFPIRDIIVEAREGENFNGIWNWSWDKIHPMGPIVLRLEPNESVELSGIWPQINLHRSLEIEYHTQVPPGTYRILGVCYPADSSISVDINIIPEPATIALLGTGMAGLLICNRKNHLQNNKEI